MYIAPTGSPSEEKIDNPGKWNLYSYAPKMNKTKEYGDHVVGQWTFTTQVVHQMHSITEHMLGEMPCTTT